MRAKISEENEIVQKNIIQLYDIESKIYKFYRVAKISIFKFKKFFKNKSSNLSIKEYNNYLMKSNFEKDAKYFIESHSSHIEILVPCSLKENESKGDPFLNVINKYPEIANEDKTIITKYLAVQPRFLLMTQKQKTEFWTGFTSDDSKSFCKQLQNYAIKKNHEFNIMEKIQNSWYCLPD